MNYNQELIDFFPEDSIASFIKTGKVVLNNNKVTLNDLFNELEKNNRNDQSSKLRLAVENYIIKYYNHSNDIELQTKMKEIFTFSFNYLMQPIDTNQKGAELSNYWNSVILKNDFVKEMVSKEEYLKYVQRRKQYSEKSQKIFEKWHSSNDPDKALSDAEKTILMNYFCKCIKEDCFKDPRTSTRRRAQEIYFASLISSPEKNSTNINEIEFLVKFAVNESYKYDKDYSKINPEVLIISDFVGRDNPEKLGGYAIGTSFIAINPHNLINHNELSNNLSRVHIICHEYRHCVQKQATINKEMTPEMLIYYRYSLIDKYPLDKSIFEYKLNYRFEDIELDAQRYGFNKVSGISERYMNNYYAEQERQANNEFISRLKNIDSTRRPSFYAYKRFDKSDKFVSPSIYNVERLNEIMLQHPKLLKEQPSLQCFYNDDGTQKSFNEIVTNMSSDINPNFYTQFAYDYLYEGIRKGNLELLELEQLDETTKIWVLKRIMEVYSTILNDTTKGIQSYSNEDIKISEDIRAGIEFNNVNMLNKMKNFMSDNLSTIISLDQKHKDGNFPLKISPFKREIEKYVKEMQKNEIEKEKCISYIKGKKGNWDKFDILDNDIIDIYSQIEKIQNNKKNESLESGRHF